MRSTFFCWAVFSAGTLAIPTHVRDIRGLNFRSTFDNGTSSTCNGTFSRVSAQEWVDGSNPGWNLGNTLDATPTEGDWGNAPVVPSTFDDVKNAGFKSVRLPTTWAYHFITGSPTWEVDPAWLQRVSDVVDMVTERDMYVLVNVHHDSWIWADVTQPNANYTMIEEKFQRLWEQIGEKLACKSSRLAFEPINEPPGTTAAHAAELTRLENIFIQALQTSGGFNSQRVVTLNGLREDSITTSEFFVRPTNITNPWAIQYHYYSPCKSTTLQSTTHRVDNSQTITSLPHGVRPSGALTQTRQPSREILQTSGVTLQMFHYSSGNGLFHL